MHLWRPRDRRVCCRCQAQGYRFDYFRDVSQAGAPNVPFCDKCYRKESCRDCGVTIEDIYNAVNGGPASTPILKLSYDLFHGKHNSPQHALKILFPVGLETITIGEFSIDCPIIAKNQCEWVCKLCMSRRMKVWVQHAADQVQKSTEYRRAVVCGYSKSSLIDAESLRCIISFLPTPACLPNVLLVCRDWYDSVMATPYSFGNFVQPVRYISPFSTSEEQCPISDMIAFEPNYEDFRESTSVGQAVVNDEEFIKLLVHCMLHFGPSFLSNVKSFCIQEGFISGFCMEYVNALLGKHHMCRLDLNTSKAAMIDFQQHIDIENISTIITGSVNWLLNKDCKKLRTLIFNGRLSEDNRIEEWLPMYLPRLQHLALTRIQCDSSSIFEGTGNIISVKLRSVYLHHSAFFQLMRAAPNCKYLDLIDCSALDHQTLPKIATMLHKSLHTFKFLVKDAQMVSMVDDVIETCTALRYINITMRSKDDIPTPMFCRPHNSITALFIESHNMFTFEQQLPQLLMSVKKCFPSLTHFGLCFGSLLISNLRPLFHFHDLQSIQVGSVDVHEDISELIISLVKNMPSLRYLSVTRLSEDNNRSDATPAIAAILESKCKNTLKQIRLININVGNEMTVDSLLDDLCAGCKNLEHFRAFVNEKHTNVQNKYKHILFEFSLE
jgi:hypothetical protein